MNKNWKLAAVFGLITVLLISTYVFYSTSKPESLGNDGWFQLTGLVDVVTIIGGLVTGVSTVIQVRLAMRADKREEKRLELEERE